MKLVLIDGSNMVMRCAYGGDLQPEVAVPSATGQITRILEALQATHLVICLDTPDFPSWRKKLYPEYKAHRKYSTAMWLEAAALAWAGHGWHVAALPGYEADDLIATLTHRIRLYSGGHKTIEVHVVSSDSDLLPLLAQGARVHRPGKLGELTEWTEAMVQERYGCSPAQLPELKALMGESGDNLPGAKGIGEKGATALIQAFGRLTNIYTLRNDLPPATQKLVVKAKASQDTVFLTLTLATLRATAPLPPLLPKDCSLHTDEGISP